MSERSALVQNGKTRARVGPFRMGYPGLFTPSSGLSRPRLAGGRAAAVAGALLTVGLVALPHLDPGISHLTALTVVFVSLPH